MPIFALHKHNNAEHASLFFVTSPCCKYLKVDGTLSWGVMAFLMQVSTFLIFGDITVNRYRYVSESKHK
jgi:hypothetical protein